MKNYNLRKFGIGYIVCILIILTSCQDNGKPERIIYANYTWDAQGLQDNWHKNWYQPLNYGEEEIDGSPFLKIRQGVIFENSISKKVILEKGKNYIIESEVYFEEEGDAEFGLLVSQNEQVIGYNFVREVAANQILKIGTKIKSTDEEVEIILGFRNRGLSSSYIKSISVQETEGSPITYSEAYANTLNEELSLSKFDSGNYHHNVVLLVGYVNTLLVTPLNVYYALPEKEKSQSVLDKADSIRRLVASDIETNHQRGYFTDYLNAPVFEVSNAYCVKASNLHLKYCRHLIFQRGRSILLMTRGLIFTRFSKLWHPYWQRWVIIDPYYGISYQDHEGNLLGFDGMKDLASRHLLDSSFLKHEPMEFFYFNLGELEDGWNDKMFKGAMLTTDQLSYVY